MKTPTFDLEASSRLLKYNTSDKFAFEEITNLQSQEQLIKFSALLDIRQSGEIHGQYVDVWLMHICNDSDENSGTEDLCKKQTTRILQLCRIPLFDYTDHADRVFSSELTFEEDPRPYKQLIKCNFNNVPIDGPGTYAVSLSLSDGEEDDRTFLDCSYIEIT